METPQLFGSPPIDPTGAESEEDVTAPALSATKAVVSSADWTVETIVRQLRKGRIDLNPKFQRRAAWTDQTKSRFIESAVLNYPIPQLVLAELPDKSGQFLVIDGKQRLLALRQFYAGDDQGEDAMFDPLRLRGLSILPDLNNFTISDLEMQRSGLFDSFENHTIRTVVIRNWESDEFLYILFHRLNSGSVPLSPQELRQALVPGPFVEYVDLTSGESPGLRSLLNNSAPDRRMVDAELLVRFLGFQLGPIPYRGNLKQFLDDVCRVFNTGWDSDEREIRAATDEMESAIQTAQQVFDRYACRKWNGVRWERAFNRAIFDVQVGAFADEETRRAADGREDEIRGAFQALCTDEDFLRSISATTKTVGATDRRFEGWYETLSEVLDRPLVPPRVIRELRDDA